MNGEGIITYVKLISWYKYRYTIIKAIVFSLLSCSDTKIDKAIQYDILFNYTYMPLPFSNSFSCWPQKDGQNHQINFAGVSSSVMVYGLF